MRAEDARLRLGAGGCWVGAVAADGRGVEVKAYAAGDCCCGWGVSCRGSSGPGRVPRGLAAGSRRFPSLSRRAHQDSSPCCRSFRLDEFFKRYLDRGCHLPGLCCHLGQYQQNRPGGRSGSHDCAQLARTGPRAAETEPAWYSRAIASIIRGPATDCGEAVAPAGGACRGTGAIMGHCRGPGGACRGPAGRLPAVAAGLLRVADRQFTATGSSSWASSPTSGRAVPCRAVPAAPAVPAVPRPPRPGGCRRVRRRVLLPCQAGYAAALRLRPLPAPQGRRAEEVRWEGAGWFW